VEVLEDGLGAVDDVLMPRAFCLLQPTHAAVLSRERWMTSQRSFACRDLAQAWEDYVRLVREHS
jgi:hypothetical protein